ncbi:unnamed protein product [Onchocerca ochengi]|uniref:Uncharacterized protein n=1 Tax=Onchocerca ochengi TaxID=42157 RepID=A0A182ER58_ONCOC|nr:unnamed protein product [Onchocerca ochengi]
MPSCHSQCTQQSASVIISVSQHQLPLESIPQNQLLSDSAPHHQLLSESVPQHQLPLESIPQHQLLSDSVSHHQLPSKSVPQHQLPLESIPQHQLLSDSVSHHQLPLESNSLQHEPATYNNNMPNLTQVPCASICMPSCPNQCIYQSTMLSGAFYPSLSPALTYPSPIIQLQPTASESKQQHSAKIGKISTNTQKTQHFSACLYICQDNCMQQCLQQNRSTDQCSISCSYACHDNCAKQRQQQQQQLTQSQELPQFIHHQSQQISRIQHSPSFIHIRQVQKIPNTKISQEQYYQSNVVDVLTVFIIILNVKIDQLPVQSSQ